MKKNVGVIDSAIRILLSIIISVLNFTGIIYGQVASVALVVGGLLMVTGLLATCPLYHFLKINTCTIKK